MEAAAHTPGGYGGVSQAVGREFVGKDSALMDKLDAIGDKLDALDRRLDAMERADAAERLDAIETVNGFQIREGKIESGPNMDWNKWYIEKGGKRKGPFNTKREARSVAERTDAAERLDGRGERTVKRAAYQQKIKDGEWEVEYEPDSNGRATIIKKRTGQRETIRVDAKGDDDRSADHDQDQDGSAFTVHISGEGVDHKLQLSAETTEEALKTAAEPNSWLPGADGPRA